LTLKDWKVVVGFDVLLAPIAPKESLATLLDSGAKDFGHPSHRQ
jgi:hypothetical protein